MELEDQEEEQSVANIPRGLEHTYRILLAPKTTQNSEGPWLDISNQKLKTYSPVLFCVCARGRVVLCCVWGRAATVHANVQGGGDEGGEIFLAYSGLDAYREVVSYPSGIL